MIICLSQPLRAKNKVRPRSMSNRPGKTRTVCTSRADSVEATGAKPPSRDTRHVKLRPPIHVVQHAGPESIRRLRVSGVRRRVRRPGNLNNNRRPATIDDLVGTLAVIGPVPIKPGHEQHDGDAVGGARFLRYPDVQRDFGAVTAGAVSVRNHLLRDDGLP